MPRRTKQEALATRHRLLDSAEMLFHQQGVSKTTLQQIAEHAGTTRGAIYWHFKDKADLFNAMMERVTLPMESAGRDPGANLAPLEEVERGLAEALRLVTEDPQVSRVFEIASHKVEYTEELRAVRDRHLTARNNACMEFEQALRATAEREGLRLSLPPETAALVLHALVAGLIQDWLLDNRKFNLVKVGLQGFRTFLRGLR